MQIHPNSLKLTRDRRTVTSRQAYHKRHHVTVRLSDTPQIHLVSPTLVYVYRHDIQCIYHLKIRHMPHNNQQQVNSIPFAKRKTQNIRYHKIRDIASATSSVMSVFAFPYIFLCPRGIEKHTQHGVLILKKNMIGFPCASLPQNESERKNATAEVFSRYAKKRNPKQQQQSVVILAIPSHTSGTKQPSNLYSSFGSRMYMCLSWSTKGSENMEHIPKPVQKWVARNA